MCIGRPLKKLTHYLYGSICINVASEGRVANCHYLYNNSTLGPHFKNQGPIVLVNEQQLIKEPHPAKNTKK